MKKKLKKSKWRNIKRTRHYDPEVKKKTPKVRITTFLDADVLNLLKAEAAKNEEGYQTLLNRIVKERFNGSVSRDSQDWNQVRNFLMEVLLSHKSGKNNVFHEFKNLPEAIKDQVIDKSQSQIESNAAADNAPVIH